MSIVAVAAIAASLLFARGRADTQITGIMPAGDNEPARVKLDAMREAGL